MLTLAILETVLESITDGLFIYDNTWHLIFVNKRGEEMARRPRADLLGMTFGESYPEIIGSEFERRIRSAASENKPDRFNFHFARFDCWYEINAFPSSEGLAILARDITEILQEGKELEHQIEERTALMNATIRELEAFSYSVSHDLRAPLRAIDGFSKMLIEDYESKLGDEGRRILSVIRHNTVNMGQLIDGLLAFSRLGRQNMGHDVINMTELARDAMKEVTGGDTRADLQFTVHDLPSTVGDRLLLRQVLINLLSNAVKFTRNSHPAVIEVGGSTKNGHNLYYVRDNGAGFDMRYVDKLFGVFQRLHAATEFEGTGLGLAIVQRVVSRHGGRVWAEGKVDHGASIYFTLPAAPSPE
jgi:light-regulated signal transduction histidine kinase (bacteriophytochrome)